MARAFVVLTAVGPDRVGIVDDLAGAVSDAGCNIEESKMSVLGGEFAVIMLISGPEDPVLRLASSLAGFGRERGLTIECHPTTPSRTGERGRPYLLSAVSLDTPGIVHSVTEILRRHGVNIEDLQTDTAAAPWTGAPMFRMTAHLILGPGISAARLKDDLSRLQQAHDLDITLSPVFASIPETTES